MISKTYFPLFLFITLFSSLSNASDLSVHMTLSPAGSFDAKTAKLRGDVVKSGDKYTADSLWVKIEDLKTGIDLRDDHFHKHLNFEKFPKISMTNIVAQSGKGSAMLTINGVPNKQDFTYKQINDKKIEAHFNVKPSAYKLKEAKYLEIGVDDDVEVTASMDVK
ncbi:MAG: YceI family protein [Bacteriovorax sp.]|nr:YceI family protein [Bacteriovorax sp.]